MPIVTASTSTTGATPGSGPVGTVSTTDATLTTLATIAIPASTTLGIEAWVVGRRTGGASGAAEDAAHFTIFGAFKNVAGAATEVGQSIIYAVNQQGWDCSISCSSGNALIRVTGAANNNIDWKVFYRTMAVS